MFGFSRISWLLEQSQAIDDLQLAHLWILYPGDEAYELDETISVLPVTAVPALIRELVV